MQTEAYLLLKSGNRLKPDYYQNQSSWGTAKRVSFWAFAVLAVGGVVEAEVEFVPEFHETRARPLPPQLAPSSALKASDVSAVPYFDQTGGGVTVMGRF